MPLGRTTVPKTKLPFSRARLLDDAFTVTVRFQAGYRGYETEVKVMAALRRRSPGLSPARYQRALSRAMDLYRRTLSLLRRNKRRLRSQWRVFEKSAQPIELKPLVRRLQRRAPGFRASTYAYAIFWVWYWHFQR
jgi:hypothetical protein